MCICQKFKSKMPKSKPKQKLTSEEKKKRRAASLKVSNRKENRLRSCILRMWFDGKICTDCKNTDVDVFENDHINNNKILKKGIPGTIATLRHVPLRHMGGELRKCQPVCVLCHRIRTHTRNPSQNASSSVRNLRAQVDSEKTKLGKCGCCGFWDPNRLYLFDFDHKEGHTKVDSISQMVDRCYSWCDILTEIRKCRLLCGNCHRKHTANSRKYLRLQDFSTEEKERAHQYLYGTTGDFLVLGHKKPVAQVDKSTGVVVAVFRSCTEAAQAIGGQFGAIAECLQGTRKSYYKFLWESPHPDHLELIFDDDEKGQPLPPPRLRKHPKRKAVVKIDPKTSVIIDIFPSIDEAARSMNCDHSRLGQCVRGDRHSYRGFMWEEAHPDHLSLLEGFYPTD